MKADFGVSCSLEKSALKTSSLHGTPCYMAPELFISRLFSNKMDIWSLGITCIELAQGVPPLGGISPYRAMRIIPKNDPPTLENPRKFSVKFNDFIAQCLIKDPDLRPDAETLLRHPFVIGQLKKNGETSYLIANHLGSSKQTSSFSNLLKEFQRKKTKIVEKKEPLCGEQHDPRLILQPVPPPLPPRPPFIPPPLPPRPLNLSKTSPERTTEATTILSQSTSSSENATTLMSSESSSDATNPNVTTVYETNQKSSQRGTTVFTDETNTQTVNHSVSADYPPHLPVRPVVHPSSRKELALNERALLIPKSKGTPTKRSRCCGFLPCLD